MTAPAIRNVLASVLARYDAYRARPISLVISDADDMFRRQVPRDEALAHYLFIGRSAIDVVAQAMIATGRTTFASILDLPCGGGRVTRHLRAFLPEAALYVGDLAEAKVRFTAKTFGAEVVPAPDFSDQPSRTFDLIWVGSLVTHFNAEWFRSAVRWFIAALADDGVLVLTTHGRRHDRVQRTQHRNIASDDWQAVTQARDQCGFGYVEYPGSPEYGLSLAAPSWVLRLVENEPTTHIIGYHEAAWNNHQDVMVLQNRALK